MLEISSLNAWYGPSHVIHGLTLAVRSGEILALIGRNGAGKTTTIKSVILKTAVGFRRSTDCSAFSTVGCVSRTRSVAVSAIDGPEEKLGKLSRGFAASAVRQSTAPHFL
jgi:ABC-type Na+ transport system ATPase subunit NatA